MTSINLHQKYCETVSFLLSVLRRPIAIEDNSSVPIRTVLSPPFGTVCPQSNPLSGVFLSFEMRTGNKPFLSMNTFDCSHKRTNSCILAGFSCTVRSAKVERMDLFETMDRFENEDESQDIVAGLKPGCF